MASLRALWPPSGLVVRTPRLELRWPDDDDLLALAELAGRGVHADDEMPFTTPWTRGAPDEVRRRVLQWHWRQRGVWTPESWSWEAVTVVDGRVVGTQGMNADDFAIRRVAHTGSWLGREFQGRGIGTEMRSAMLHLAFAGLGAERAETEAFVDNLASLGVTQRLGYADNGDRVVVSEGRRRRFFAFAMSRAEWEARRRDDIEILGLEACLPLFGAVGAGTGTATGIRVDAGGPSG